MNLAPIEEASLLPPPTPPSSPRPPRTQKARGIAALARFYSQDLVPPFQVHSANSVSPEQLIGFFSRPCPMRPRHGFVDSRKIDSMEEADRLIRQTLEADPEAEIVTMPLVKADYSGIWTAGMLTIGPENDGATAGTAARTVPALGNLVSDAAIAEADIHESPYVELLWPSSDGQYRLVQLRDGPLLPQTVDYIPRAVKIEAVIPAYGDLLAWEVAMREAPPGTVVHHPGGSLASHYAIHAVLNEIPVLISREPQIGEELAPEGPATHVGTDIQALRAGFHLATRLKLDYEEAARIMLAGCHHISVWAGRYDALLGVALGLAYRLTVTAALGEMRHAPGREDGTSRESIYDACWNATHLPSTRASFQIALFVFHGVVWKRNYGGAKWFEIARWAATLHNHLVSGHADLALKSLNQLVHCVHNTGWAFNKFIDGETLDVCARNPINVLVLCAPMLYQAQGILDQHGARLAKRFTASREPVRIPKGPPNLETYEEDDRYDRNYRSRERRCDEPMRRRRSRGVRDRSGRTVVRGVDGGRRLVLDIPF